MSQNPFLLYEEENEPEEREVLEESINKFDLTLTEFEDDSVHLYVWENDDSEFASGHEAEFSASKEEMIKMAKFILEKLEV